MAAVRKNRTTGGTANTSRKKETLKREKISSEPVLSVERPEVVSLPHHIDNVLNGLEVMWRQSALCDVTLVVGTSSLRAHRAVLCTCSDYFHQVFTNRPEEQSFDISIAVEGIRPETAYSIIECMYTGNISLTEGNVKEMLSAASYFRFYSLERVCAQFLIERLCKSNCLRMLTIANTFNLCDLTEQSLKMAALYFMEVADGFDFLQLQVDLLISLIKRDDLVAPCEMDVFNRAMAWVDADRPTRQPLTGDILQEIRLPLLTPSEIIDHVETRCHVSEIPACQVLIKEALHYHCLPARQSILQSHRTCPRSPYRRECVVCVGGAPRLKSDPISDQILYLDTSSDTWEELTRLDQPRHHHAIAVLGGFLYVAGGEATNDQQSPLSSAHRYDPRSDTWLQIADMKQRRESFQLTVLNDMLYAVGGRVNKETSLAEVERYDPAVDRWEQVAPLSSPRRSVATATMNGRLYAMGGSGSRRITDVVERFNPLSNAWERRKNLLTPRFFASLAAVGTKLYLVGGATLDSNSGDVICAPSVDVYTPATDTWTSAAAMLEPRAESGFAVVGSKIYVAGGYSWNKNKRLVSVESYDVDKNTWTRSVDIPKAFTGVACGSLTLYRKPARIQENNDTAKKQITQASAIQVTGVTHTPLAAVKSLGVLSGTHAHAGASGAELSGCTPYRPNGDCNISKESIARENF